MVRPGTTLTSSVVLVTAAAARAWADTEVTVMGTACRFSPRRCAVTTTSGKVVSEVDACAAAGVVWALTRPGAPISKATPHRSSTLKRLVFIVLPHFLLLFYFA